jgi:HEAT repeat protein
MDIDSLLSTLEVQDVRVKVAAIASLGRCRDRRALKRLIGLLGDGNRSIREASVRALGAFGDEGVGPLIEALGNRDWHIRMGSAIALRIIGDSRAVEPLIRALSDESRFVKREAAKSLGRIGDPRATEPLISVLEDPDEGVRIRAAAALGKIADPKAIAPLTRALSDRNSELQEAAVEALSKIKNSVTSAD